VELWETILVLILVAAIFVISISRRRYILVPSRRNKTLAVAWIITGFLLPTTLWLLNSRGWDLPIEILLALHLLWPWFLLLPNENQSAEVNDKAYVEK